METLTRLFSPAPPPPSQATLVQKLFVPHFVLDATPPPSEFSLSHCFSFENDAATMSFCTVVLTLVLELVSLDAVRKMCRTPAGRSLYAQGVAMNIINNCILGPISYEIVNARFMSAPFTSTMARVQMVGTILLAHAIGCAREPTHDLLIRTLAKSRLSALRRVSLVSRLLSLSCAAR